MPNQERAPEVPHQDIIEEPSSLDELARGLATGALSRRQVLKLTGAAFLGGALSIFGLASPAEAKRRRRRRSGCVQGTRDAQTNAISCAEGSCLVHPDGGTSGCCLAQATCQQIAGLFSTFDCTCAGPPPPPPACPPPCPTGEQCVGGACCPNEQVCGS